MQLVLSRKDELPAFLSGGVLAIGNFDGVHVGHRAVLARARDLAKEQGVPFGIMSFEPHPRVFFQPTLKLMRLTPQPLKEKLFSAMGAAYAAILPFDGDLSQLTAEEFLQDLVIGQLKAAHVVVGFDFHFGKGRGGSPSFLTGWGAENGRGVSVVTAKEEGEGVISSSRIRAHLAKGEVEAANQLLGYRFVVEGVVSHGAKRGRELGFPTANIALPEETNEGLAHGIYAVRLKTGDALYNGVASFGRRPQFDNGAPLCEVYLFGFDGDLYGAEVACELIAFLRGEEKFASVEALIAQMHQDCTEAKAAIERAKTPSFLERGQI